MTNDMLVKGRYLRDQIKCASANIDKLRSPAFQALLLTVGDTKYTYTTCKLCDIDLDVLINKLIKIGEGKLAKLEKEFADL